MFCRAYSRRVDEWLEAVFNDAVGNTDGLALVAVGGYGRNILSPQSDLDLLLICEDRDDIAEVAEKLWYPIWDEGIKLGHAVRTIREGLTLAKTDLDTATSLLHLRHIAGDDTVSARLREGARNQWRRSAKRWLPRLAEASGERRERHGEVAFLLEPDLKQSFGGLRDVHAMQWAAVADPDLVEPDDGVIRDASEILTATRVELHRVTGRIGDTLRLDTQDEVAAALGIGDADELMARVAAAGRSIAWFGGETWARVRNSTGARWWNLSSRLGDGREVAEGVLLDGETIRLAHSADLTDPLTVLRVAAVAAENSARIDRGTLEALCLETVPLPDPWPAEARSLFVRLLATGHDAIDVIETLDQTGLFVGILPEWEPNRSRPQRNAYHTFTVDRHLMETAALAAGLVDRVERRDLLLVGALLHDIGKGYPGDHTEVGIDLVTTIGRRMGFDEAEVATLTALVEFHLLLPDVATRRDIEDDETISAVAVKVGDVGTLRLLHALTEADSIATGPAAWSSWKASLVEDLVRRAEHLIAGGAVAELESTFPTAEHLAAMEAGLSSVDGSGDTLTVITPDSPGILSRVAGALALNGLDVLQAAGHSEFDMAVERFEVTSSFGTIDWRTVVADVEQALAGRLALEARLADRLVTYRQAADPPAPQPVVETYVKFDNESSSVATVVELGAADSIGLLYRVTAALAALGLDVSRTKVQTLGDHVVDSFYVRDGNGEKIVDPEFLEEVRRSVRHAIPPPVVVR